jgi:hypothetical protein
VPCWVAGLSNKVGALLANRSAGVIGDGKQTKKFPSPAKVPAKILPICVVCAINLLNFDCEPSADGTSLAVFFGRITYGLDAITTEDKKI